MADVFGASGAFQARFADAVTAAEAAYTFIRDGLCKLKVPPPIPQFYGGVGYLVIVIIGTAYAVITSFIIASIAPLASAVLKIISDIRTAGLPELNKIAAESLGELLGVDFPTENLTDLTNKDPQLASARNLGKLLHERLITEFVGPHGATPKSGEEAAQAFTGYVTRFATGNAFLSIIADLASLDHLSQFRELGVEVAENLGLGRLHRRTLQPLIDATIVKPYTKELNSRYTPNRLTDTQYVNAFQSGRMDEATLRSELGYQGYSKGYIDELIAQLEQRPTDADIEGIMRWQATSSNALPSGPANGQFSLSDLQRLNPDAAIKVLKNRGMSEETARQRLVSIGLQEAKAAVNRYALEVETLAVHGFIEVESARSLLQNLPLSPEDFQYRMRLIGLQLEFPRKTLTLAEMEHAYIEGIITVSEWDAWVQRQGYSAQDQQTLTFLLQVKADAASHKGKTHVAVLTFAEIATAYVDGFIDLAHAESWMQQKGYSPADQATLRKLLQAKAARAAVRAGTIIPPSA